MERLYAVPSEQLRVWLVWLSKVGDMADEWHKWLRSHIDFVLRLSIELRAAEEVLTLEVRFRPSATDIFQLPIFIVDITRNDGYAKKMEFTFASVIN